MGYKGEVGGYIKLTQLVLMSVLMSMSSKVSVGVNLNEDVEGGKGEGRMENG